MSKYRVYDPARDDAPIVAESATTPKPLSALPTIAAAMVLSVVLGMLIACVLTLLGTLAFSVDWFGEIVPGAEGYGVVIVEETQDRYKLSADQLNAMNSHADGSLRRVVEDRKGIFRLLDKDDDVKLDKPEVQAIFALKRDSTPWVYVWKNRKVKSFPLTSEAGAVSAAKSYGGN